MRKLLLSFRNWLLIKLAGDSTVVINAEIAGMLYSDLSKHNSNLYSKVSVHGVGFAECDTSMIDFMRSNKITITYDSSVTNQPACGEQPTAC